MKRIVLGAALLAIAGGASAANSLQPGEMALSVDAFYSPGLVEKVGNGGVEGGTGMIKGKYMMARDLQVNGGFGFGMWGDDADGTDLALSVGVRKFMRTDDLAPFMGGRITHATADDGDTKALELAFEFGAEYFVGKDFSVEGSASIGYVDAEVGPADVTRLGTSRAGVGFNFYF